MNNDLCLHCGASLHFNDETGMFCPACAQQKDAMQAAWEATRRDANEAAKQRQAADRALAATEAERLARSLRGEQMPPPFAVCEGHEKRLDTLQVTIAEWSQIFGKAQDEMARRLDELLERLDGNDGLVRRVDALEADQADTSSTLLTVTGRSVERLEAIEQKLDYLGLDGMAEAVMRLLKRVADLEAANEAEDAELNAIADERAGQPVATLAPVVTRVEVRDHFGRCLFFAAPANDVDLRYSDDGKTLTVVLRR